MKRKRILFIGAGRMAQAIIEGLKKRNEFEILVTNSGNKERLYFVKSAFEVEITNNWKNKVSQMDIIFLAMPPEAHESILNELAGLIEHQLVITIAAGISTSYLEAKLPQETPVVCVMPNTAAKLGKSMTLYTPGRYVHKEHLTMTEALICGIGEYEKVTEKQIQELTAITGSAPAFIYRIAEALEKITIESGVTKEQARKLVSGMLSGSAAMLQTNTDPAELINQVATPGGSTAEGLKVLDSNQIEYIIKQAITACREKMDQHD